MKKRGSVDSRQIIHNETSVEDDLRHRLPRLIVAATDRYEAIAAEPLPDDPKEAQSHLAACKAAVSHLDCLIKVWRSISRSTLQNTSQDTVAPQDWIDMARRALAHEEET